uniref:Uncharacterized protein n=1 Tax=Panagrolaimus sp. ES5 TaxID=591445 RepID=A0AC34G0P5_9BILA
MSGYQIGQNFNCNGINYKLTDIETDGDVTRITYKGQYFEVGQSYNNNGKNCTISRIYVQGNDVTIYLESEEEYEDFDLILPKKYLDNLCLLNKSSHLSNDLIDESNQAVQLPNFIDEKSEIMIQSQHNQSQQRWFERIYFCLLKSLNCFTVTQNDDEADTTQSIGEFLEEGDSSEHEFLERYRILNSNVYKLSESDQKRYTWYCQMLTVLQYNIMNGNDKTVVLKLNLLIGRVVDEEGNTYKQTFVRTAAYGLFEKLINIGSKELKKKYEKEKVILEQYGGGPKRNSSNTGAVSVRNSAYCPGCPFKSNGSNLSRHFYISCKKPFFHEGTKFSTCLIDLLKQVIASGKRVTATEIIEAGTETLKSIPKFAAILQEHIDTNTMGSVYVYVNEEFDAVLNLLHEKATKNNNYVERGRRNVLKGDHNDYSLILKTTLDFIQNSDEPLKAWLEKLMHLIYWGHSTNFSFRDDSSIATCLSYGMLKYVSAKYYHFLYPLKKLLCGESIEELRGKTVKIIRVIENVPLILAQYYETCGIGDSFHPFMTNVQIGNRSQFVEVGDKFGSETFSETGAMLQLLAIQSKPEELKIFDFLKDPKLTSFDSSLESYVQANKINNVHLLQSSFSLHCLKSEDVVAFVNRVIPSDFFQKAHGISIPSSFSSQSSHIQRSLDANLFSFENDADNYFFNVTYSEGIGMPDTEEGYIHFRISDHSRNLFDMNRIPIDTTTCEDGNGLKAFLDGDGIVFGNRDVYPMAEGPEGQDTSLDPISAPTRSRGEQFDHDFDGPEPMDSQDEGNNFFFTVTF